MWVDNTDNINNNNIDFIILYYQYILNDYWMGMSVRYVWIFKYSTNLGKS